MDCRDRVVIDLPQRGFCYGIGRPRPRVTKPKCRQYVERSCYRRTIPNRDLDEQIFRGSFRVFDEHIEITVIVKYAGIEKLILEVEPAAAPISCHKIIIGESRLRILV